MTRGELLEKRRARFEDWAASEGLHIDPDASYSIPIRAAWMAWKGALDSVEIELPSSLQIDDEWDSCKVGFNQGIEECRELIQQQGYKAKSWPGQ